MYYRCVISFINSVVKHIDNNVWFLRCLEQGKKHVYFFRDCAQFCQTASGQMTCFQEAIRLAGKMGKGGLPVFIKIVQPMKMFWGPFKQILAPCQGPWWWCDSFTFTDAFDHFSTLIDPDNNHGQQPFQQQLGKYHTSLTPSSQKRESWRRGSLEYYTLSSCGCRCLQAHCRGGSERKRYSEIHPWPSSALRRWTQSEERTWGGCGRRQRRGEGDIDQARRSMQRRLGWRGDRWSGREHWGKGRPCRRALQGPCPEHHVWGWRGKRWSTRKDWGWRWWWRWSGRPGRWATRPPCTLGSIGSQSYPWSCCQWDLARGDRAEQWVGRRTQGWPPWRGLLSRAPRSSPASSLESPALDPSQGSTCRRCSTWWRAPQKARAWHSRRRWWCGRWVWGSTWSDWEFPDSGPCPQLCWHPWWRGHRSVGRWRTRRWRRARGQEWRRGCSRILHDCPLPLESTSTQCRSHSTICPGSPSQNGLSSFPLLENTSQFFYSPSFPTFSLRSGLFQFPCLSFMFWVTIIVSITRLGKIVLVLSHQLGRIIICPRLEGSS